MPRLREWIFSANSFVAAMLALYISLAIGLERPFWAMATVYIVSRPLSGTVRSKAALVGFPSVNQPENIFSVALLRAQEIGVGVLCATLTHTLFFPRSVSRG
jgi:uncharacterized membrane protein YccC